MQRKMQTPRNPKKMEAATKIVSEGELLHVLLPHSIRYHIKFTIEGRTLQYVGEIPDMYDDATKDEDFDRIMLNAIIYVTHWVKV